MVGRCRCLLQAIQLGGGPFGRARPVSPKLRGEYQEHAICAINDQRRAARTAKGGRATQRGGCGATFTP